MLKKVDVIEAHADLFVVPNSAMKLSDWEGWGSEERTRKFIEDVCKMNRVPFDEDDYLVQVWYTAMEDLHSENLVDHMFTVSDGETEYIGRFKVEYLPYSLIRTWKEGEAEDLYLPITYSEDFKSPSHEAVLALHVTPNQKDYRYRRFGNFQGVAQWVVSRRALAKVEAEA